MNKASRATFGIVVGIAFFFGTIYIINTYILEEPWEGYIVSASKGEIAVLCVQSTDTIYTCEERIAD